MTSRPAQDPEASPTALLLKLAQAPVASREPCLLRILAELQPQTVLTAGLALYRQGRQEWLLETTAAVLREFGPAAWHTLLDLCRQAPPEAWAFVGVVAECPAIDAQARERAVMLLAAHPAADVRQQVLEAVAVFDLPAQRRLLSAVRDASSDDVRIEAEWRLALLDQAAHGGA